MVCKLKCLGMGCSEALALTIDTAEKLKGDDVLDVLFDCPCSAKTIPSWARKQGFYVEMQELDGGRYRCLIERA